MARGRLVVLEGAEGAGKTTQIRLLAERLTAAGVSCVALREPGGTPVGDDIREILLHPEQEITAATEALLFMASRAELIAREILPSFVEGNVVLMDRFFLSTYAYQIYGRGLAEEEIRAANRLATGGLVPDITLLIDVPPAEGLSRADARGARDRMERADDDFHDRVGNRNLSARSRVKQEMKLKLPSSSARARTVIVAGTFVGAVITGGWLLQRGAHTGTFTAFEGAQLYESVFRRIQNDYVDAVTDSALYAKSVDGMLYELRDPYSTFLPPDRFARLNESTTGNYAGLGVEVDLRDGWLIVVTPLPGGPAERAGLQPGDRITEIAGKPTKGWTNEEGQAPPHRSSSDWSARRFIRVPCAAHRCSAMVSATSISRHSATPQRTSSIPPLQDCCRVE